MLKVSFLSILWCLVGGCGKGVVSEDAYVWMPAEVLPYYNEYFQIVDPNLKKDGVIVFAPTPLPIIARCYHGFFQPWRIELDPTIWDHSTEDGKRVLVFHELTHCTFDSGKHSLDPYSYMYSAANTDLPEREADNQVVQWTSHL